MAGIQLSLNVAKGFFKRNNPFEAMAMNMVQGIYNLITLHSRMKLLKYRYMLETQKLERIENTLTQATVYEVKGNKMNRKY